MTVTACLSVRYLHLLGLLTDLILISAQEACRLGGGHPAPKRVLQEEQVRWRPPCFRALLCGGHKTKTDTGDPAPASSTTLTHPGGLPSLGVIPIACPREFGFVASLQRKSPTHPVIGKLDSEHSAPIDLEAPPVAG